MDGNQTEIGTKLKYSLLISGNTVVKFRSQLVKTRVMEMN